MSLPPERPLLHVERAGLITRVKVAARELRESNVQAVGEGLLGLAAELSPPRLLLDLGEVTYLTSTALGQLVALHKRVRAADGELVVANVTAAVYEVFRVTRLHQLLDIRPGEDDGPAPVAC
ncbi:MAG TPA: STAS domain-containing protein [Gemmataceae bacterium]|nr:STAS domain-containing protein [Gemmataceae bacterium]